MCIRDRAKIDAELEALKKAVAGTDVDAIKNASEQLSKVSYDAFGKIYQQQAQQQQANGAAGANPNGANGNAGAKDDNVVDAEYEEVKDDEKK